MRKHGKEGTPVYDVWVNMKQRCQNQKNHTYKHYGGRGIKVCEKWQTFIGFYEDMGDPPTDFTLDRIDNDGDYCRENCRWIHYSEQGKNTRRSRYATIDGVRKHVVDWSKDKGLNFKTVLQRMSRDGMTPEEAILTPFRKR